MWENSAYSRNFRSFEWWTDYQSFSFRSLCRCYLCCVENSMKPFSEFDSFHSLNWGNRNWLSVSDFPPLSPTILTLSPIPTLFKCYLRIIFRPLVNRHSRPRQANLPRVETTKTHSTWKHHLAFRHLHLSSRGYLLRNRTSRYRSSPSPHQSTSREAVYSIFPLPNSRAFYLSMLQLLIKL